MAASATISGKKYWSAKQQPEVSPWDPEAGDRSVDQLLQSLGRASVRVQREVLLVLGTALSHDDQVTVEEAELFGALVAALDAPSAPVLASV